jgi:hypothetical protein
MLKSIYYPEILSTGNASEGHFKNDRVEKWDVLETAMRIEPEEVEATLGLANSVWPELVSHKRGRHSYAYYQSDF